MDSLLPIRTISRLTGVNAITLRAWERRYNLLTPTRTPKGHRLYSMADVEFIKKIVALLDSGITIGQVQNVLSREPDSQTAPQSDELSRDPERPVSTVSKHLDLWHKYQQRFLTAIHAFDEATLHELYNDILALYPVDVVTKRLIVPLLHELGWRWERNGQLDLQTNRAASVAEEHFFSMFLRNKLGARLHHTHRHPTGPCLIAACLPDEQHDMGLILFSLAAMDWHYRVILLGAAVPLAEIVSVSQRTSCDALVLAGSTPVSPEWCETHLRPLLNTIKKPVFIGGQVALQNRQVLKKLGLTPLDSDFKQALQSIRGTLNHAE